MPVFDFSSIPENEKKPVEGKLSAGAAFFLPKIIDDGLEGSALDELHRIEKRFPILPDEIMNGNNVGMSQLGQHLSFKMKTRQTGWRVPVDHLDRNGTLQLAVFRDADTSHASPGDLGTDHVMVESWRFVANFALRFDLGNFDSFPRFEDPGVFLIVDQVLDPLTKQLVNPTSSRQKSLAIRSIFDFRSFMDKIPFTDAQPRITSR